MDPKERDPVMIDLLHWLKENLPPDTSEELIFKKVSRMEEAFSKLMKVVIENFYKIAIHGFAYDDERKLDLGAPLPPITFDEIIDKKLEEMQEYANLLDEKQLKNQRLDISTAKLDLKRHQYNLITSIKLDSCMDLISRYNRLMSKK